MSFSLITNLLVAMLLSAWGLPAQSAVSSEDRIKDRLKERVEELYRQRTADYSWYYRLVFAVSGKAIAARVIRACEQQQCDNRNIDQAIQQNMYYVGKRAAIASTYGVVFAGIMLSAYGGAKFSQFLSGRNISEATKNFVNVFVPIITGMGVFSIGAPLWDPARSFVRRWAFANNQFSKNPDAAKYPSRPDLEAYWLEMQKSFSVNAQISRNTLSAFLVLVSPSLQDIRVSYTAGKHEYAAAQLAKCLVQLRYIYSELDPAQPIVLASVRSYFRNLQVSAQFMQQVMETALILDPLAPTDSDYYTRAVRLWLSDGGDAP